MSGSPIFRMMVEQGASDLFLKSGAAPSVRVAGRLRALQAEPLGDADLDLLLSEVAPARVRKTLEERGEADAAFEAAGAGRFRVNVYRQSGRLAMAFRHVSSKIPALDELHVPVATLRKLASLNRGLVLITGTTGSGKSTTLAAMIGHLNATTPRHVVTVEDPIEFVHRDGQCVIEQRELGVDTGTFERALRAALRQAPDVILIGEIRDRETVEAALHAAETGHLVLSTLHTRNAAQTLERIMNWFPPHQHEFLRTQLAMLLEGVVSQRLIPTKDGKGRVPACEVLTRTPTVQELLASGRFREIHKALRDGQYFGSQTFNQSLQALVKADAITADEALAASDTPEELKLEMKGIGRGSRADSELRLGG
jgi:twitching motility protein PilT